VKPDGTAKKDGLEKTFSKSYQLVSTVCIVLVTACLHYRIST